MAKSALNPNKPPLWAAISGWFLGATWRCYYSSRGPHEAYQGPWALLGSPGRFWAPSSPQLREPTWEFLVAQDVGASWDT